MRFFLTNLLVTALVGSLTAADLPANFDIQSSVTNTGKSRLQIPIALPPGVNGHTPEVSINYDSSAPNGIVGMGFSIGGLSSIRRDKANIEMDGEMTDENRAINLSNDDKLSLDGQRLIEVGTREYRTEVDSFMYAKASGTLSSSTTEFTVKTKSGQVKTYGDSSNAALLNESNKRIAWLLETVEDRSGNEINYVYLEDDETSAKHISEITYGASTHLYKVKFEYEGRTDERSSYIYGVDYGVTERLLDIKIYSKTTLIHQYHFDYSYCPVRSASRLEKIIFTSHESGSSGTMEAEFDWYDSDNGSSLGWDNVNGFKPLHELTNNQGKDLGTHFLDLNGDGLLDMVWNLQNGDSGAARNTGSGWSQSGFFSNYYKPPYPVNGDNGEDMGTRFVDLNGDGLADVVWSDSSGDEGARLNTGTRFSTSNTNAYKLPYPLVDGWDFKSLGGQLIDINGDGLVDYVWNRGEKDKFGDDPSDVEDSGAAINTGSGWDNSSSAQDYAPPVIFNEYDGADAGARFVDLNGDGLMDVVFAYEYYTNLVAGAYINNNGTWVEDSNYAPLHAIVTQLGNDRGSRFIDINGDGLTDHVWYLDGQFNDVVGAALNTGKGWVSASQYAPKFPISNEVGADRGAIFVDINGDGMLDQLRHQLANNITEYNDIAINTGTEFKESSSYDNMKLPFALRYEGKRTGARVQDFNGDGVADQLWSRYNKYGSHQEGARINKAKLSGVLKSVTDHFGLKTSFTYKQLTDGSVYAKENSATFPHVDLISPLYVVATQTADTPVYSGSSKITYTTEYTYAGGVQNLHGRGFLGFRVFESYDTQTGYDTTDIVRLDFPYVGMVLSSTRSYGATTISSESNLYANKSLNNGKTIFPYITESTKTHHIYPYSKVFADFEYDNFGNLKEKAVEYGDGAGRFYEDTTNVYPTSGTYSNWHNVGLLDLSTVIKRAPDSVSGRDETVTRVTDYSYDTLGRLETVTTDPSESLLSHKTTYERDTQGRVDTIKIDPGDAPEFIAETRQTLDATKRFYKVSKNHLNHTTTTEYDTVWGRPRFVTDANNRQTEIKHDTFGRQTFFDPPGDSASTTVYALSAAVSVTNANGKTNKSVYKATTTSQGKPTTVAWYDPGHRVIRTQQQGFDGTYINTDTTNNVLGQQDRVSEAYYVGDSVYWTENQYDGFQRLDKVTLPDNTVVDYAYPNSSEKTITQNQTSSNGPAASRNQVTKHMHNAKGMVELVTSYNDSGSALSLTSRYDGSGRLIETEDNGGRKVEMFYDIRGNKIRMIDPEMGEWEYLYDARGRLEWQEDAEGNVTDIVYDNLNRVSSKTLTAADTTIPAVTRNFYYDGTNEYQELGKLHLERSSDGFRRAHYYDDLGRTFLTLSKIDGRWFYEQTEYDTYSRPIRLTHYWRPPSIDDRSGTHYLAWYSYPQFTEYNERGYVKRVYDNYGTDWWESPVYNAQGQLTSYISGNGLKTLNSYNPQNHRVDTIQVLADTQQLLSYDYDFDPLGNLESREDLISGQLEELVYDRLNRLKTSTIDGTLSSVVYDDFGNITSRTGIGAYTYPTDSYKVSAAGGRSFTAYNANGAITAISGSSTGTIQWNAFNKVHQIEVDNARSSFGYDSNGFRTWQMRSKYEGDPAVWNETTRKTYVGPLFEQEETKADGTWDIMMTRIYIATPAGVIGSWVDRKDQGQPKEVFFHRDHLGSVIAESGAAVLPAQYGEITRRMSFEAWGNYRSVSDWNSPETITEDAQALATDRGYTGHEMLNKLGIIHMNGRIYDPKLGRFLSPDPIIQAPNNLQNYNRYSYVLNSPLSNTDPSGFVTEGEGSKVSSGGSSGSVESNGQAIKSDSMSANPTQTATGYSSVASVDTSSKGDAGGITDVGAQTRDDESSIETGAGQEYDTAKEAAIAAGEEVARLQDETGWEWGTEFGINDNGKYTYAPPVTDRSVASVDPKEAVLPDGYQSLPNPAYMHSHPNNIKTTFVARDDDGEVIKAQRMYFSDKDVRWTFAEARQAETRVSLGVATPDGAIHIWKSTPTSAPYNNEIHGSPTNFAYRNGTLITLRNGN